MADNEEKPRKEPPDFKDVESGPLVQAQRQCRDICCCCLFWINVVVMIGMSIYGYSQGTISNIYRATTGYNVNQTNQYICGNPKDSTYEPYYYTYFYNPFTASSNFTENRFCVKSCPSVYTGSTLQSIDCMPKSSSVGGGDCNYDLTFTSTGGIDPSTSSITDYTSTTLIVGYATYSVLGRVCIPKAEVISNGMKTLLQQRADQFVSYLQGNYLNDFISDISNNWYWILCGIGFTLVIAFLYMFLLKFILFCAVWGAIFGILILLLGLGVLFLYASGIIPNYDIGYMGIPAIKNEYYYSYYAYAIFGVALVYIIVIICCCNRIRLAVNICSCAGQFVVDVYRIIIVPVIMAFIQLCVWALCLPVLVYLIGSAQFVAVQGDIFTSLADLTSYSLAFFYYFIFATLWCNALVGAVTTFVIASACTMWYYSHGPGGQLDSPILRSYKMVFRFHFGSLAFGSFILAFVQWLEVMVEFFRRHIQTFAPSNQIFQYVFNCLRCCLACLERLVQYLNKQAYIQIAIRGKMFCLAAKDGFEMVWANPLRYLMVSGLGQVVMFLGKFLIALFSTVAFYCLISFVPSIKESILSPLLMILLIFVIGFLISTVFMSIYNVAVDTILACFIIDEINTSGKGGQTATYAPPSLQGLMNTLL